MRRPDMRAAHLHRRQVKVRGRQVTYKVAGAGHPVVLVHGLAGSTRWWARTIPALARQYTVYLVDLPGFGSMRRFAGGFVLEEAASWLLAWLEALDLRGVHMVGHSMGGYISLKVAVDAPQAVRCLALIDPAGLPLGRSTLGHIWPLVKESLLSTPGLVPVVITDALRAGPRTLWRAATDLLAQDVRADLHAVTVPTLIVWGEKDSLVPLSLGYVLRRDISHSRLLVLEGSRHVPMIDSPHRLNQALLAFFAGEPVGK